MASVLAPDIIIGPINSNLKLLYDGENINESDYVQVYKRRKGTIWKGIPDYGCAYIYVKREIAERLGLRNVLADELK